MEQEQEQEQPPASVFDQAATMNAFDDPEVEKREVTLDPAEYGIDLTDHGQERSAIKNANANDGVSAPEELPHPHTNIQNQLINQDPIGDMKREIDPFKSEFSIGEVVVTPAERDMFVRSALHDTEMVFDIHLEGPDIMVKVAVPTEAFTVFAANTLDDWSDAGLTNGKSSVHWLLGFQQLHAWYQVREFAGKPTAWSGFFDDGVPKLSAIKKHASDIENMDDIVNMSPSRWRLMINAMALAEYKYKMCLDAWRTRAFFEKADTA